MSDTIFESIKNSLVEQMKLDPAAITLDSKIADDLGADSLDAVELIMALEEEYDITIETEDAEKLETVGDVVKLIEALKA
jgi:acyl carrier protein